MGLLVALASAIHGPVARAQTAQPPSLLQKALNGPLRKHSSIVFAERQSYADGHWYANIGYFCEDGTPAYAGGGKPGVTRLLKLDLRSGKETVLVDAKGGCIRDPAVHYDGSRILFAWRKANQPNYLLHEIRSDGTGLRQITSGKYDDYEPTYLPDDSIVFVSTRCRRWVNCWKTQVANRNLLSLTPGQQGCYAT